MTADTETSGTAKPRVKVVIPTYNRASYLKKAIDSVLSQSEPELRLHISDNASTDETSDVVAAYTDPRLSYTRLPENVGWLNNFNIGFAEGADTEYVMLLGDDDVLLPGALRRAVEVLDAHPRVGMVHAAFNIIGPDDEVHVRDTNWMEDLVEDTIEPGRDFLRKAIDKGSVCVSTVVVRSCALPPVPYEEEDAPATDHALWLRIALDWDIAYLSTPGCDYRVHPAADSARWGRITASGYVGSNAHVLRLRAVKLRFIDQNAQRLPNARHLRRMANWAAARRIVGRLLGPRVADYLKSLPNRLRRGRTRPTVTGPTGVGATEGQREVG